MSGIYKSLRDRSKEIIAESKTSGKLLPIQGNISYIEKFTKDDNLIVKGRIRNNEDLDFNFVAFGKVAESMRNYKPNDSVNFLGGFDQQNNSQIKLINAKE